MDLFDLMIGASNETFDQILSVDDLNLTPSEDTRFLVNFKPDGLIGLSIIRSKYSYGYEAGLYEIALLQHNELDPGPFMEEWGDSVKGYLTENEVREYLKRAAAYARKLYG